MIVVTGANGFIGSVLVRDLNDRGYTDIICVDTAELRERPEILKKAKYSQFLNPKGFLEWVVLTENAKKVTAIFHMGAISSTTETDWDKLVDNNIEWPKTLFRFCSDQKIPFIYASSGAVYGGGELGFDDNSDTKKFAPLNLYGKSKREFDIWALEQSPTPPLWAGLRFFNVYGPNEYHKGEMSSVVYKAYLQIRAANQLKLFRSHNEKYKDGEQLRDFVYVKDITRWMIEISTKTNFKSGIYNLGYGKARSWLELARAVFGCMNQPVKIDWVDIPAHIRNQYQYFTEAKMTKAQSQGLSAPQFDVTAGVTDYLKNYLLSDDPYV